MTERTAVMASFLPDATMELILRTVEEMKKAHVKCTTDNVADAISLVLTACLDQQAHSVPLYTGYQLQKALFFKKNQLDKVRRKNKDNSCETGAKQ